MFVTKDPGSIFDNLFMIFCQKVSASNEYTRSFHYRQFIFL